MFVINHRQTIHMEAIRCPSIILRPPAIVALGRIRLVGLQEGELIEDLQLRVGESNVEVERDAHG